MIIKMRSPPNMKLFLGFILISKEHLAMEKRDKLLSNILWKSTKRSLLLRKKSKGWISSKKTSISKRAIILPKKLRMRMKILFTLITTKRGSKNNLFLGLKLFWWKWTDKSIEEFMANWTLSMIFLNSKNP